jgi:hypothetical protein
MIGLHENSLSGRFGYSRRVGPPTNMPEFKGLVDLEKVYKVTKPI